MKDSMNADSYKDLDWVLGYSDSGFFAVIAPEKIQHEVAERYSGIAAIYDYKKKPEDILLIIWRNGYKIILRQRLFFF